MTTTYFLIIAGNTRHAEPAQGSGFVCGPVPSRGPLMHRVANMGEAEMLATLTRKASAGDSCAECIAVLRARANRREAESIMRKVGGTFAD